MTKMELFRKFSKNLQKISQKLFPMKFVQEFFFSDFLLIFDTSENLPKSHRELSERIFHEFCRRHFSEFLSISGFSESLNAVLMKVHFRSSSTAESREQDSVIFCEQIRLHERRAGSVCI